MTIEPIAGGSGTMNRLLASIQRRLTRLEQRSVAPTVQYGTTTVTFSAAVGTLTFPTGFAATPGLVVSPGTTFVPVWLHIASVSSSSASLRAYWITGGAAANYTGSLAVYWVAVVN